MRGSEWTLQSLRDESGQPDLSLVTAAAGTGEWRAVSMKSTGGRLAVERLSTSTVSPKNGQPAKVILRRFFDSPMKTRSSTLKGEQVERKITQESKSDDYDRTRTVIGAAAI